MRSLWVFLGFLALRVLSVFLVRTWYVPDEYWQSLEVAHKLAFGYGHLTWEWTQGIRSYFHPAIIALLYKAFALVHIDNVLLLTLAPRILQALLTAYSDFRFYKWSGNSKWSIFILATAWFWFYTGSRTLSNTVETSLSIIALSYFPWHRHDTRFLWPVAIAAFVRPTSVIPWIPLCFHHIRKSNFSIWEIILKRYVMIGLTVGLIFAGIDSYIHGSFIFTPYEFLKVNVFNEIGSFYGTHPWHWYFSAGLPTILGIGTIPFMIASSYYIRNYKNNPTQIQLLISILFTLFVYSLLPHKEFRFILPILPMCLYISSEYLSQWSKNASAIFLWTSALVLLIGNIVPAGYLSAVHQRGTIDVMPKISELGRTYKDEFGKNASVLFLMPCHSTPYYSHVHNNITLRFLTCEPNLDKNANYVDEADLFYKEPMKWIRSHLPVHPRNALPTHVVLFDILAPKISDFLSIYKPLEIYFHADVSTSDKVGKNVILYERIDPTATPVPKEQNIPLPKKADTTSQSPPTNVEHESFNDEF